MDVKIPADLLYKVPEDLKMDFTLIDIKLKNGIIINRLAVMGNGRYIVGHEFDTSNNDLVFTTGDIMDIRATMSIKSIVKRLFGIW